MKGATAPRPPVYVFTVPDTVSIAAADVALIPWIPGQNRIIRKWTATIKTAPTGANLTGSIKRYTRSTGAVLDTVGTVTIVAGNYTASGDFATPVTLLDTQALAFEPTQVGSTVAGSNLAVAVD